MGRRDERLKQAQTSIARNKANETKQAQNPDQPKKGKAVEEARHVPQALSHLFFEHNEALLPPYKVLLDTNFFSHAVRNKVDVLDGLMDTLLAKVHPIVTECTIAELEKLGDKFRLALRVAKDERWQRLRW